MRKGDLLVEQERQKAESKVREDKMHSIPYVKMEVEEHLCLKQPCLSMSSSVSILMYLKPLLYLLFVCVCLFTKVP